jgi:hypothetical protein
MGSVPLIVSERLSMNLKISGIFSKIISSFKVYHCNVYIKKFEFRTYVCICIDKDKRNDLENHRNFHMFPYAFMACMNCEILMSIAQSNQ